MYYSPSMRGFFDETVSAGIPADAVEITAERHLELLDGQSKGRQIAPDADGTPVLQDQPPPKPRRNLKTLEFLDRFTDTELAGIHRAAQTDDAVAVWMARAQASQLISLDGDRTQAGMRMLVDKSLLTANRRDEILA